MIRLLIGGSPCTHWSVAQHNNREVTASGIGWELFKNYKIALTKFKPDFFLYENNKSAAQEIKNQISHELNVPLMHINSALVSAQNRQRFYAFNWTVPQPEDRHIQLSDILDPSAREILYDLAHVSCVASRGRYKSDGSIGQHLEPRTDGKTNTLTTVTKDNLVIQLLPKPVRLGDIGTAAQAHRVYSPYGKSVNLTANGGGQGAKTGLYMIPADLTKYSLESKHYHIVKNGVITTRYGAQEIDLPDGDYIIRRLTPLECERLQTLPDGYTEGVSDGARYKAIGNGWTADVIEHILTGALGDKNRDEEVVVLSMYDGIATGRLVLDRMGFKNVRYYAYEIDEDAIKIAKRNWNDIVEMGDAFQVRDEEWKLPQIN